jgi:glycosyltransferase involved in cell wall biosynthesis
MTRIHLIYPYGPAIKAPESIGRHLAQRLRHDFEVIQYDWAETRVLQPGADDILLGHPHDAPWTIFRRSARKPGWRRVIAMFPYSGDPRKVESFDAVIPRCDLVLAITGSYWFDSVGNSMFSHWAPKMIHLELAVDRDEFPIIKTRFNPPGSRRFLYIGNTAWHKNPEYLSKLATLATGCPISWMGTGAHGIRSIVTRGRVGGREIKGTRTLGAHDFRDEASRRLVAEHDFLLTVGKGDPNPTTILEAMAWGLVPVCTPTSGYVGYPGIVNIPPDNPERGAIVLKELQALPESRLLEMQDANWQALDNHFNWDRFAGQVLQAVRSEASPVLLKESPLRLARLRAGALIAPQSMLRRHNLKLLLTLADGDGQAPRKT